MSGLVMGGWIVFILLVCREVSSHLMEQLHSLKLTQSEGESELEHVQRMMDELREENEHLHSSSQRQKELIVSLQTRVEIVEDDGRLEADERLKQQLAVSEEERREAEMTAMKQLDDIILLKTQLEDANHIITDLKVSLFSCLSDNAIELAKHESLVSITWLLVSLANCSL